MPPEYCEYYPGYEQCKIWLEKNAPDMLEQLNIAEEAEGGKKKSKSQKRGRYWKVDFFILYLL